MPEESRRTRRTRRSATRRASTSLGGTLDAQDPPVRQPSNRYRHQLHQKPGHGRGLPGAASHSPSLSICGPGTPPPTDDGTPPPTDNGTPPPTDNGTPPPTDNGTPPPTDRDPARERQRQHLIA